MVAHRPGYAYGLSMSSSRIYNYECINHENMTGWYGGDGMLCCYGADPDQYDSAYWAHVNPYRLPGITADEREREAATIAQANEYLSGQDFVGGLTQGRRGFAAMRLESYHSDGKLISERFYAPSGEYGSAPPARDCTLLARKAWFFFDDGVLALGCDLSAHDGAAVYTVAENRKNAGCPVLPNGEALRPGEERILPDGAEWVSVPGAGSYRFLERTPLQLCVTPPKAEDAPTFTEVMLLHGVDPENASYAYLHFPTAEGEPPASPVTVLRNDAAVQAVRDESDGSLQLVFWAAGECAGVETPVPLLVAVEGDRVFLADPTHKLGCVTVTVRGVPYAADLTDRYGKTVGASRA
jgi:hyaluronate lyase